MGLNAMDVSTCGGRKEGLCRDFPPENIEKKITRLMKDGLLKWIPHCKQQEPNDFIKRINVLRSNNHNFELEGIYLNLCDDQQNKKDILAQNFVLCPGGLNNVVILGTNNKEACRDLYLIRERNLNGKENFLRN